MFSDGSGVLAALPKLALNGFTDLVERARRALFGALRFRDEEFAP